jgi:cytosine/adenosine deaminase-related metal-dependent hydrolase
MRSAKGDLPRRRKGRSVLSGARCALSAAESVSASIEVESGRVARIISAAAGSAARSAKSETIDLRGYLLLPGLVNAHDHLEFALYPRLARGTYRNYVEWGHDIHKRFAGIIRKQHAVPMEIRLLWGGIRNLLCGVTTVSHHNPLSPQLVLDDYPVRVVERYGWAHSVALGGDLRSAYAATPEGSAFLLHAGEGVDDLARSELSQLDRLGMLDHRTVIVHGLAFEENEVRLMNQRRSALVICPSSNQFLFGRAPDRALIRKIQRVALGSDSPLTATGDLLDEVRFAIDRCGVSSRSAYDMITSSAAEILRLNDGEGSITESGPADVIAVRDTGVNAGERLRTLEWKDIELVVIGGCVQLASASMLDRMPQSLANGLETVAIGGIRRWVRAPIQEMLRRAEAALGEGKVRLNGRPTGTHKSAEARNVA